MVTLGAAAGGTLGGYVVDKIGRKLSLMLCAIPYVFGFLIIVSAQNIWMLYLGRLLCGLASGVTSLVVPVRGIMCQSFASVISPEDKRKFLLLNQQ